MFNRVGIYSDRKNGKDLNLDVIVSLFRILDIKVDINEPFAICRQNITDFFYSIISNEIDHGYVGVSATRENIPSEIDYGILASCDELYQTDIVHFYFDDTIEDVLNCIDSTDYDKALEENYIIHKKAINPFYIIDGDNNKSDKGWCRDLYTLLKENNFNNDMDTMRNITSLAFDLKEFLDEVEDGVYKLNDFMLKYFNSIFSISANSTMVVEYFYDIDFADFANSNYILLRDSNNSTYVVVYTTNGEYLEVDIESEINKLGIGDKIRLDYYNKYN